MEESDCYAIFEEARSSFLFSLSPLAHTGRKKRERVRRVWMGPEDPDPALNVL